MMVRTSWIASRRSWAVLLVAAVGAHVAAADTAKLRAAFDALQRTRPADVPLESALRRVVRADSAFRPDSTLTPERLSGEARAEFEGLVPLLTPSLQLQYLGLSSDAWRAEWVRRYWRLKDPTPTTPENERQLEHQRRLAVARERFAAKPPRPWDDRGTIWIAFGAPDSVVEEVPSVEEGVGFVPARQDWLYLRDRWVVSFDRPNPRGAWQLGRSSARLSWRPDLVERDRRRLWRNASGAIPALDEIGAGDIDRKSDILGFAADRELLAAGDYERLDAATTSHGLRTDLRARELMRRRDEAVVRFRQKFESGGERFLLPGKRPEPLWFVFDAGAFKGPPGRVRVEVHYQIGLQDLRFAWADSVYAATYRAEGVLSDDDAREVARDAYVETVRADDFRSTLASQLLPGQLVFDVPEGAYRLAIRCSDPRSGAETTYTTRIEVPRLDGRSLALSDVTMATSIVFAGDDWRSRFVKRDRLIVPNPIGAYARGKQLIGYFEIYGLQLDAGATARYEVTYAIAPRTIGRGSTPRSEAAAPGRLPFVTSTFRGDGGASELCEDLRIDVSALDSDAYELTLTVRDLVANKETTQRARFSILD